MSYNFYSLVSSIKDKSSQAMATLSSDLKEFSSIVQEDVAEVAKTVRKTVHEQSEALRQRVEEQQSEDAADKEEGAEETTTQGDEEDGKEKKKEEGQANASALEEEEEKPAAASTSLFASFTGLSLEAMGSKILQSADELLGSLAGPDQEDEEDEEERQRQEDKLESARRYRLLALQEDSHTYIHPPMDVETFLKWRTALTEEDLLAIQEEVLAHYPTVVAKLAELVPETVSSEDFWAHYIYKASLLAAQEQRGADLLEHALNDSEEEVGWDVESPVGTPHDSPRHGSEDAEKAPSFEETGTTLPAVETADASSLVAVVGGEQRPDSPSGSDADDARTSPVESISSDGESWIELDEQRRELAQQPPLSSSSTSSFVPVDAGTGPPAPASVPVQGVAEDEVVNDEEDVDWGDDADQETHESAASTSTVGGAEAQPPKKAGGADWGEWD